MADPRYEFELRTVDGLVEVTIYKVTDKGKDQVDRESYSTVHDALFWAGKVCLDFMEDRYR